MNEHYPSKKIREIAEAQVLKEETLKNEINSKELHELRVHQIELEMQAEELVRSQEALRSSRELYLNLYELAPVGYCTLGETGIIEEANLTTADLMKTDKSALIGKAFTDFILSEDQDIYYLYNKKIVKTQKVESCELRMIKQDGTLFWGRLEAIMLNDVEGKPVIRIVISDVSSREQHLLLLNAELKIARDQAQKSNLAKSAFLANMSHELRTPLNGVIGFSSLLEMEELSPKHKEYLQYISQSGKNLLALINDILDLSKAEAEKIELHNTVLNLKILIDEVVSSQNLMLVAKNIYLKKNISDEIQEIYIGDALRLKQIINNLVSNAIKFTQSGGILISVNLISSSINSDLVRIKITDTGIGMDGETLKIIFLPFSQADGSISRVYGGTGLGLAICKKLVELMGGEIGVVSSLGVGSVFSFDLSLLKSAEAIKPVEKIKKPIGVHQFNNLKILLIEDNPINLQLILEILKILGCQTTTAKKANEGLVLLESQQFDMIFLDIQMPEMSGMEMLEIFRQRHSKNSPYQKIIALTAFALDGDKEIFLNAGFDGYVSKPIEMNDLIKEMERVTKQ